VRFVQFAAHLLRLLESPQPISSLCVSHQEADHLVAQIKGLRVRRCTLEQAKRPVDHVRGLANEIELPQTRVEALVRVPVAQVEARQPDLLQPHEARNVLVDADGRMPPNLATEPPCVGAADPVHLNDCMRTRRRVAAKIALKRLSPATNGLVGFCRGNPHSPWGG
jgi:hypothetical protein